jgi:hypothetical protein
LAWHDAGVIRPPRSRNLVVVLAAVCAATTVGVEAAAAEWGGPTTAATGETVNVTFSDSYPQDPARAQQWANLLASLVHGPELATVDIYLAPIREVQRICGFQALACYSPLAERIVAPGEAAPDGTPAESIVMHEYGHHVAANRSNAPWRSVEWGTKRWATYVSVCARWRSGSLFPGGEGRSYRLNPGEGFAEAYRLLNERRLGRPDSWSIVDQALFPDATALQLLEQDVVQPWTTNTPLSYSGSFRRGSGSTRTFAIATPLDGAARVTLRAPSRTRFTLALYNGGQLVSRAAAGSPTLTTTVCGARTLTARVTRTQGFGAFRIQVSRP